MKPIRVLIADDHELVRAGLVSLLNELPDIEIIAQAKNGWEAIQLNQSFHPDVIVLDIELPDITGLEVIPHLLRTDQEAKILILSMYTYEEYVIRAFRLGAFGYAIKDSSPQELYLAIQKVSNNEVYLSPQISQSSINKYITQSRMTFQKTNLEDNLYWKLTGRQKEVLHLIAVGKTTKEISVILHISTKTVESHRANLMANLNIYDIAGLVRYAIRSGIIASESRI
jgi:DNA-binding NarL/FixJ family response regulator